MFFEGPKAYNIQYNLPFCGEGEFGSRLFDFVDTVVVGHFEDFFAVDFPNVVHDFEAGSLGVAVGLDTADLDRQGLVLAPNDLEAPWLTRALPSQCQLDNLLGHLELTY